AHVVGWAGPDVELPAKPTGTAQIPDQDGPVLARAVGGLAVRTHHHAGDLAVGGPGFAEPSRADVPSNHVAIHASAHQRLPVGSERQSIDLLRVTTLHRPGTTLSEVQQDHGPIRS